MTVDCVPVINNYKLTTMHEAQILSICQQFGEEIQPKPLW